MPFVKGQPGGPGRPRRDVAIVLYDIKNAARGYGEEALMTLVKHMRSEESRASITAAVALIERGYGKPEQKTDVEHTHKFVIAPEVMDKAAWIATKGDARLLPAPKPDEKLN
jgi:hypothetical protein